MTATIILIILLSLFAVLALGGGISFICFATLIYRTKDYFHASCVLFLAILLFMSLIILGIWMARNWLSH